MGRRRECASPIYSIERHKNDMLGLAWNQGSDQAEEN